MYKYNTKAYIIYIFLISAAICSFYFLDFGCIFKLCFHVCCPTCGMTRAIIELFNGNINGYIEYNVFALPVFISVFVIITMSSFNIKNKVVSWICYITLILNLIYYFIRLFLQILPC